MEGGGNKRARVGKGKKKTKKTAKKRGAPRGPRKPAVPQRKPFLPAMTVVDGEPAMLLIMGDELIQLNAEESTRVANLVFANYNPS